MKKFFCYSQIRSDLAGIHEAGMPRGHEVRDNLLALQVLGTSWGKRPPSLRRGLKSDTNADSGCLGASNAEEGRT